MTTVPDPQIAPRRSRLVHPADGPEVGWWRGAAVYQVYPRSFADADGDGMGDLRGLTARLPHLVELGVDAVWVGPFYPSPGADAGYDVTDYRAVDPTFGSLTGADALLAEARRLGLRVIIDVVPNHTSDEHAWFRAALASPAGSLERDRYLFRDGRGPAGSEPPNNWPSVFRGPAWTRVVEPDGRPGQWYLHLFDSRQPDLNWRHADVRAEFEEILAFWLERGVDGFRVDAAHGLVKADGLPDTAGGTPGVAGADEHGRPSPIWDQDGVHEIYRSWRRVLARFGADRVLVAEATVASPERLARYARPDEMHQTYNFTMLETPWAAPELRSLIEATLAAADTVGAPATWALSSHDVLRHASRLGVRLPVPPNHGIGAWNEQPDRELGLRRARAATLLILALPGSVYLYQGEELGLPEHTTLPDAARQDPLWFRSRGTRPGRDGCRVPIPWEAAAPAYGFSPNGRTWLPQPEAWAGLAVDRQRDVPGTTFELYRAALRLRRRYGLGHGSLRVLDGVPSTAVAVQNGSVLVVANPGVDPIALPAGGEVLLKSADLADARTVPADVTVWVRLPDEADVRPATG